MCVTGEKSLKSIVKSWTQELASAIEIDILGLIYLYYILTTSVQTFYIYPSLSLSLSLRKKTRQS